MTYNLKQLEESLTDEQVIKLVTNLGSDEYVDKTDHIQFKTICHNEDCDCASLKLYYYKENKRFMCYTDCGESFNIFELFKKRYELLGIEYNFYKDIVLKITEDSDFNALNSNGFHFEYDNSLDKYKNRKPIVNLPIYSENILNMYSNHRPIEWQQEGITDETMELYKIKYSIPENKIIIPHYNENGELVGIRGRPLNEEDLVFGKYLPVQFQDQSYAHPLSYNLYGLNIVKDNIKKMKMAIITEGEKGCLMYNSFFGEENNICVAACGSNVHRYQVDLLVKAGAEKILIAFDKEGETYKEQEKYYKKLKNFCKKFSIICKMGFIYDFKDRLKLKESPLDEGKETFLNLYKEAIWV